MGWNIEAVSEFFRGGSHSFVNVSFVNQLQSALALTFKKKNKNKPNLNMKTNFQ